MFPPKDVKEDENPNELVRAPEKTRPLTLANPAAKILSDAFSVGLTRAAPETIDRLRAVLASEVARAAAAGFERGPDARPLSPEPSANGRAPRRLLSGV